MWITSTSGFLSAVLDTEDSNRLVVRARDRRSLEAMIETIRLAGAAAGDPDGPEYQFGAIVTRKGTDYRWRVRVSKATFAHFMSYEIMHCITYPNFKNALKEARGEVWADAASNVWVDMLAVDDAATN